MKASSTLLIYSSQIEVAISGDYHPAQPERPPRYDSGGEPAESAYVEDIVATLDNSPIELDETDTARAEAELMESV